ncbi:Intraflagellar transport protein 88 homolog [Eumeta japonica]|uniref:Intraflagellar transport protein 88 homolog n=1 Tax=Eumeta variegata TaxID=151549 RepID=A0A4C1VW78_EUMVA|nr:Intraflagellar transport protein 88 homolog [Eumeta japonica]
MRSSVDEDDDLYSGFDEVSPALDTRALREDEAFQETLKSAGIGRKLPTRMGTGMFRQGTVRVSTDTRAPTASARPMTAVRAAGYTSATRAAPILEEKKEDSIEDKIKQMETRIMALVEESCALSARPTENRRDADSAQTQNKEYDLGKALAKAQEASALERQLIRMQEQANLGDSHNLDLTFSVLCNLAGQYALNEMYTEALNTYQLLTRNKLFPHANRLKVNMGNIYFKMGEHPKALKLYRMALDQTPTAEKDLRMKVMHNIGLLLVRMGKFRDAVTNFQHIMHEQGDFQTGQKTKLFHLQYFEILRMATTFSCYSFTILFCGAGAEYAVRRELRLDWYPCDNDAYEAVMRDVLRGDRLSQWSRSGAAHAERCLALAAAALAPLLQPTGQRDDENGMWWCVEALRGWEAGGAGARLELGAALAALRTGGVKATTGQKALQRLKAVARAHPNDRAVRAEANADAAFIAYALGNFNEARSLSTAASQDDPYACSARVTGALAAARLSEATEAESDRGPGAWRDAVEQLTSASHLDPADLIAMHDLALAVELSCGDSASAGARWSRVRGAGGAGPTLRAFAAAGLARLHETVGDPHTANHWYSSIGTWDAGVTCALARLHSDLGDTTAAKHHYQDVEAAWPCEISALEWLAAEARATDPELALQYYRRAAAVQPTNPQWGLLMGGCLRAGGRYQDALALYKKMNERFPDNTQCLKLIVKLCGDQGLPETTAWNRELQRAQARLRQQDRNSVPSAGSGSSGASQSPIDQFKSTARADSAAARSQLSTASSGVADRTVDAVRSNSGRYSAESTRQELKPLTRSLNRLEEKKKSEEFDEDLPLPPE